MERHRIHSSENVPDRQQFLYRSLDLRNDPYRYDEHHSLRSGFPLPESEQSGPGLLCRRS